MLCFTLQAAYCSCFYPCYPFQSLPRPQDMRSFLLGQRHALDYAFRVRYLHTRRISFDDDFQELKTEKKTGRTKVQRAQEPRHLTSSAPFSAGSAQEALPRQQQLGALRTAVVDLRQLLEGVRMRRSTPQRASSCRLL